MKDNIKLITQDKGIRYAILFAGIILLFEIILLLLLYPRLPPLVPLFNSLSWGRDRLVPGWFLFGVPVFLFLFFIVSILFLRIAYKKHALLARMLFINLLLSVFLSVVAMLQIFLLVF